MFSTRKILMLFCFIVCIFVFNIQCKKEDFSDNTYFGSKVIILGHRGMGTYYKLPGDTYESIIPAIGIGSDGCEIDIQLTKDTELILYHDFLLSSSTTCSGRVSESTLSEIKQCEYHSIKNDIFVYSLDEIFSRIPDLNKLYFSFDCKLDDEVTNFDEYQNQFLRAVKRICEKYNMSNNVFIEGNSSFLRKAQSIGLTNKLFLTDAVKQSSIDTAVFYGFFGICTEMENFEVESQKAHENGLYIMTYTPNNYYSNIIALNKDVDILQTDDPISILKLFERYNYEYIIP